MDLTSRNYFLSTNNASRSSLGPAALDSVNSPWCIVHCSWNCTVGTETYDDYDYDEETPTAVSHSSEQVTVVQYLADTETHLLTTHNAQTNDVGPLKKMSLSYNAALPSSTPVESLLSVAGLTTDSSSQQSI